MDYKETLLMPKTDFKMKGGLSSKEPRLQEHWKNIDLYNKKLKKNEGNEPFILHDGPPYANGSLHMGHALNKIIKDFIIRYKQMNGYYSPYVPGWDTHGLPIEQALISKGIDRGSLSKLEFRKKCLEFAYSQIDIQRKGFKRMGIDGHWDDPYITSKPSYEAAQVRVLKDMVKKGLIYRGKKPIYWSPISESSLAEAELEYIDKRSPSIYVSFNVKNGKNVIDSDVKFVIWTTTPWTIPSNLGLAVHPDLTYVKIRHNGKDYIIAKELTESFCDDLNWDRQSVEILKSYKGKELEFIECEHPLFNRTSLVILGDHVTTESGTGIVHTAPGHGEDDYLIGKKYNLDILSPIDNKGVFTEEAGKYKGIFYDDANKLITEDLEKCGALLKMKFITHSYPHDWRSKTPVIFRATPQWFASVENIKEDVLGSIMETKFQVKWNQERMYNMIKNRGDWVISRQRVWGVPLPFFYAENGEAILDTDLIEYVAKLFEEHGTNIWFEWSTSDLLPEGYSNVNSPNGTFSREMDIMDVWFDSGSSHRGVLALRDYLTYPADLYFEGSDQYRGWFNSSIITSVATSGHSPYKELLSHGFTMDGKGKKMSKSLGNVILPEKIMNQMGADIVRLWVMSSDYESDVRVSDEILKQNSEVYRKIRNTFRFLLGNINNFNPESDSIIYDELKEVDKFIYNRFAKLKEEMINAYEIYDYLTIYQHLQNFINVHLSNFYLDYAKDILYVEAENSHIRRSSQTVIYKILTEMNILLAPVLVHTTEEIYSHTPYVDKESVHLESMPEKEVINEELIKQWEYFLRIRDDVLKALENARSKKIIGKSLDAKIRITQPSDFNFHDLHDDLTKLFIVSQIEIVEKLDAEYEFNNISVKVEKADGIKCERCWNYTLNINGDLCDRCDKVVNCTV